MQVTIAFEPTDNLDLVASQIRLLANRLDGQGKKAAKVEAAPGKAESDDEPAGDHEELEEKEDKVKPMPEAIANASVTKRGRPKGATKKKEQEPEFDLSAPGDTTPELDDDFNEVAPVKKAFTAKDTMASAKAHAEKFGKPQTVEIIRKFGVRSIVDLKPEQYADFMRATAL